MAWARKKSKAPPAPLLEEELYTYAVGALGRRMRTEAELKRLLKTRVEPDEIGSAKIVAVVARLKEYKFLDDESFASHYTKLRQENQALGRRRVQRDLMQKGVSRDLTEKTLEQAYEEVNEEMLARQHLDRKRIKPPSNEKEAARIVRQLMRAGFAPGVIFKVMKNWKGEGLVESLQDLETADSEAEDEIGS